MKPEFEIPLLEALSSGIFKKTKGFLKTKDGYCCLGVAAKIFKDIFEKSCPNIRIEEDDTEIRIFNGPGRFDLFVSVWPEPIHEMVGITLDQMRCLARVNDQDESESFEGVIHYIKAGMPNLMDTLKGDYVYEA